MHGRWQDLVLLQCLLWLTPVTSILVLFPCSDMLQQILPHIQHVHTYTCANVNYAEHALQVCETAGKGQTKVPESKLQLTYQYN